MPVGTISGRTVDGVFAVFCYKRIDEADRELSCATAETTIFCVEDAPAYYCFSSGEKTPSNRMDAAGYRRRPVSDNFWLAVLFGPPFRFGFKQFYRASPRKCIACDCNSLRNPSRPGGGLFAIFFFNDFVLTLPVERFDVATRLQYCFYLSILSYLLYRWVRYLFPKGQGTAAAAAAAGSRNRRRRRRRLGCHNAAVMQN